MNEFTTIGLDKIGLRYSNLRVVFPRSEQQMFRSLKNHGQISRLIVTTNGENQYELISEIQLGLVPISVGRELAKLPYGNQKKSLDTIRKHRLTCREAEKLVGALLESHPSTHESVLRCEGILTERDPPALRNHAISQTGSAQ